MKKLLRSVFCILFLFGSIVCAEELKGTITVSGAWAIYPTMVAWADAFQKINPGVKVDVSAGGAGKGAADTIAGLVDFGMVSRNPDPGELEQGIFPVKILHDAVFPVISEKNPALPKLLKKGISKQAWMKLYVTGEAASWSEIVPGSVNKPVHVYTRSDSCGAASSWAAFLGSKKQEDLKGIGIYGDPGLLEAVKRDPIGVGYNNFSFVFDKAGKVVAGVKLAPIDANNNGSVDPDELIVNREKAIKSIESGNYSVTRNNYLFSKGKPQGLKLAFIEFILSEEGTRVVNKVQASLPFKPAERAKIIKELKENK